MVTFTHLDAGTPEARWQEWFGERSFPRARTDVDHLVVISAHPDDETLGVAGLMRTVAEGGGRVSLIVATDGEHSHPDSPTHTTDQLAAIRRREVDSAMRALGLTVEIRFLGAPDGDLGAARDVLEDAVRSTVDASGAAKTLLVAPWHGDGHRDHRVAGEVAEATAQGLGIRYRGYPVWLWHWGAEQDAPWSAMEVLELGEPALRAKSRALEVHLSQVAPLSDAAGDEAVLPPQTREHFVRSFEVLIRPSAEPDRRSSVVRTVDRAHFDSYYSRHDDPWGFETSWYEQRKRDVLLGSLPRARYGRALELGCSTGVLTQRLADRCDHVVGVDFAATALERARRRLRERPTVRIRRATLPSQWPRGRFDLVVMSEIGYFWDRHDLALGIERSVRSLTDDGHLVACHWRHPVASNPVSGDAVHAALRERSGLTRVVSHVEADFVLEVFAGPGNSGVAPNAVTAP